MPSDPPPPSRKHDELHVPGSLLEGPIVRPIVRPSMLDRRTFLRGLTVGTVIAGVGGASYVLADDEATKRARRELRQDGRPRLPPNQYLLQRMRPMGGSEGDPSPGKFRLRIGGEVEQPFEIDFAELLRMPQIEQTCDVHCVTKWSLLDSKWTGVRVADLAARAKVRSSARFVVFEAAAGYTANLPLKNALAPNVLVAHRYEGQPIPRPHGPPVRALVPDLYFWKSAKWLTGISFLSSDHPGYWETRGYHNRADPWREERYG